MANNIDELHFEVILKDDAFRQRVEKDIELADKLNIRLSDALNFNKKVQIEPLKRVSKEFDNIEKSSKRANKAGKDYNSVLGNSNNLMRTLGQLTGVAFSVVGLRRFLSTLIDVTGQFEVQKMALRNMLQDIDKADKIFDDLYQFSSKSTYRFSELAKYAKQLAAFNIAPDSLLETTKRLGDVASGVGVSMDRIILAYGHVKSSGFLRGIQLRSFSQNGVPVLEELAKMLEEVEGRAVSLGDVFDRMMKRQITFEMVEEAFKRMTSEGGKFYQMQEVLAKTLAGQINILKGKWENLMYAIGESQEGILKGSVQALTKVVSSTESFGRAVKWAISILSVWKTAALVAAMVTDTLTLSQARFIALLDKAVRTIFKLNLVSVATGAAYVTLAAAIGGTIVAVRNYTKVARETNKIHEAGIKEISKFAEALSEEKTELDRLYSRLKLAKEGTQEYAAARNEIIKRFNPYIEQLREEGVEVNDLATIYENLAGKIEDANRQRFLESASKSMGDAYNNTLDTIKNEFETFVNRVGNLSTAEVEALRSYYKGQISKEQALAAGVPERAFTYGNPGGYSAFSMGYTPWNMGFKEAGISIDALAAKYKQAGKTLEDTRKEVADAMEVIFGPEAPGGGDAGDKYVYVSQIVTAIKQGLADVAALEHKAATSGLLINEEKGIDEVKQLEAARESLEADLKQYKDLTGKDYLKSVNASASNQAKDEAELIRSIERLIALNERYRKTYDDLFPIFGEDTAEQMKKLYGDGDYTPESLNEELERLLATLRALGSDGEVAAQSIAERLGFDDASRIKAAYTAMEKWQKTLRKLDVDYGGDYSGIEHDIDKVYRAFDAANKSAEEEYLEGLKEIAQAYKDDADGAREAEKQLRALIDAKKDANRIDAQEKINDYATKYVNEKTAGMPLKDWGDKSISQVKTLWEELNLLASSEIVIDAELEKKLTDAGLTIEDFCNLVSGKFEELSDEAQEELKKKVVGAVKTAMSGISTIGSGLEELGDALGDSELADAGRAIQEVANGISGIAEGFLSGGPIGAAISAVTWLANAIFNAFTATAKFEAALRAANEEARKAKLLGMLGDESIFGENGMKKLRDAASVIKKVKASMAARNVNEEIKFGGFDKIARLALYGRETIADLAKQLGRDLYDSYGNLNAETLQAILDTYEKLDSKQREWIEQAINDSEVYEEAMKQLDSVLESVFGGIASSAADQIVDQWAEAGDAALDYVDILDDVARAYAKMITQSMLIDSVLTPEFKAKLQQLFNTGDTEGAMALIMQGLEQIQSMAPQLADALEPLRPYIKSSTSGDSLKDGINKELVEGNSSLIASYMNAMRADLSVLRVMQTSGWQDVRLVRETMPTLVDYAAQVAANTHDNAQNTQAILSKLQSIITPSTNGGSAVRTTK